MHSAYATVIADEERLDHHQQMHSCKKNTTEELHTFQKNETCQFISIFFPISVFFHSIHISFLFSKGLNLFEWSGRFLAPSYIHRLGKKPFLIVNKIALKWNAVEIDIYRN